MPLWGWSLVACAVLAFGNWVQFSMTTAARTERDMAQDRVAELEAANEALEAAEATRAKELAQARKDAHERTAVVARAVDPSGCADQPVPDELLRALRETTEASASDAGAKAHP